MYMFTVDKNKCNMYVQYYSLDNGKHGFHYKEHCLWFDGYTCNIITLVLAKGISMQRFPTHVDDVHTCNYCDHLTYT